MEAILAAKFTEFLKNAGGVLAAVAILLAMVTIHEFGHYLAGKALGFKINEFSVGFGPAIYKKRSKKTGELFALRVIPLGGYCAFDGEDDTEEESAGGAAPQAEKRKSSPMKKRRSASLKRLPLPRRFRRRKPRRKNERKRNRTPNPRAKDSTISPPGSASSCCLRAPR